MADAPPPVPPAPESSGPAATTPVPAGELAGRYSPDGFWWWDGSSWKPAYSQDRLWRWNGQTWVPAQAAPARSKGVSGLIIGLIVGAFVLVVLVVAVIVFIVLGNH
jgi:hypothetical protein